MRTKVYKTIQIRAEIQEQLKETTDHHGWTMGFVVERLVSRFLAGHFSGSMADAIRIDASKEEVCECGGIR